MDEPSPLATSAAACSWFIDKPDGGHLLTSGRFLPEPPRAAPRGDHFVAPLHRVPEGGDHSAVSPRSFTSLEYLAVSLRRKAVNSAGEALGSTSMPRSPRRFRSSGSAITLRRASNSFPTTGCGVPAGRTSPLKVTSSYRGNPDSMSVGMSGNAADRVRVVTPSAFTRPDWIAP